MPVQSDQAGPAIYQHLELAQHVPADDGGPGVAQLSERQAAERRRNRDFQQRDFQNSFELRELAGACRSGSFVSALCGQLQIQGKGDVDR